MLTLQYIPYVQIQNLSSEERIEKLLGLVSEDRIILLEGRLKKDEEVALIQKTMEQIGENSDSNFRGIELSTIDPNLNKDTDMEFVKKLKNTFMNILLGDRQGMTVVGPASIVKEIKQDPEKIELFINNLSTQVETNLKDSKQKSSKNDSGTQSSTSKSKSARKPIKKRR